MSLTDWIPVQYRLLATGLLVMALASASAAATWQVQNWRYGQQLERQARLHGDTLNEITLASAALQRTEQAKRLQVEQQLQGQDETHYQELTNAKKSQARLRDRLATADVRLSVLQRDRRRQPPWSACHRQYHRHGLWRHKSPT
jgi:hypothetical protein